MPIFAYFAVVAPVLLGLLCVAESVMGPPGAMPLTTSTTGLPVAFVAPKVAPVLTVREGIVAEIPKSADSYALASTGSVPAAAPAQPQAAKTKVAKAKKKVPQDRQQDQQFAQGGWQQNQPFGGGWEQRSNRGNWDQQSKRSNRSASNRNNQNGRYAMSGQPFFSPFGTIR